MPVCFSNFLSTCSDTTELLANINSSAKDVPIGELLSKMDSDNDSTVSVDELYNGLLELHSDSINGGFFVSNLVKNRNLSKNKELSLQEKAETLIDSKAMKAQIKDKIGNRGLDLNDLLSAISKLIGYDVKSIIKKAKSYGINIKIENLSIKQIEKVLEYLQTPEGKVCGYLVHSAIDNVNKGNYTKAIGDGLCIAAFSFSNSVMHSLGIKR